MYPRLNPKTNNFCVKIKHSLSILQDDKKNKQKSQRNNSYLNDDLKANKFFKVKTYIDKYQKQENHQRLNKFSSKQNTRHSSCLHHLPQKFNHLRGKRRSLQMALMLYQNIEDQKKNDSLEHQESTIKKNSLRKLNFIQDKNKNPFFKQSFSKILEEQNKNLVKCDQSFRLSRQKKEPLSQVYEHEKNRQTKNKQEYNFISKSITKKSMFKNRIMQQILQNNIDQWQNQPPNDQNGIFYQC